MNSSRLWIAVAAAIAILVSNSSSAPAQLDLGVPAGVLLLRDQVNELLKAANHAVDTFGKESAAWRKAIDDLQDKLKATGQDLLANDMREFSRRVIGDAGVEFRFNVDFTEAKAKTYLAALRDAIGRAKNKLLLTTDLKTAQEIVAGITRDIDTTVAPAVPAFSPSIVKIGWKDHKTPQVLNLPGEIVSFTGYALRPKDPKSLRLSVLGKDDEVLRDATEHLTIHTPYTASIDFSATGLKFEAKDEGDRRLRLIFNGETVGDVKIQWNQRPSVPQKMTNFKAVLKTTTHKEGAGQVELTYFHAGRKIANSLHSQKRRIPIINRDFDFTGHIGAYRTWEKGHSEEFVIPNGLQFSPDYAPGDEIKVQIGLGCVPDERNVNWRGEVLFSAILSDGKEIPLGSSGGFWFRNNVVEDPQHLRGNGLIEVTFKLPPLPPL